MAFPLYVTIADNVTSRDRLAWLKKEAAGYNAVIDKNRCLVPFVNWESRRFYGFDSKIGLSNCFKGDQLVWYTHYGPEFRDERTADKVINLDYTGWFIDSFQRGTIKGIVARLPHGRFIAGTLESGNGERVYYPTVYDDERQAAREADHYAEKVAEEQREYNERWCQALEIQDEIESCLDIIKDHYKNRHDHRYGIKYVIDEVKENVNKIRDRRERLKEFSDVL